MRNLSLLIFFLLPGLIFSEPKKEIYELIDLETLKSLSIQESDTREVVEEKISKSLGILEDYLKQFPDDRRTLAERKRAGDFKEPSGEVRKLYRDKSGTPLPDVNSIRLLHAETKEKLSRSALSEDSNSLYLLYSNLGLLYYKNKEHLKALNFLGAAFKFHDFSQSEESIFLEIDSKDNIPSERKEKARNHNRILTSIIEKEKQIQKLIDDFHLEAATQAKMGKALPDEKSFRTGLENTKRELESLQKEYEASQNSLLRELQEEKGKYDAKVLKTLALCSKSVETGEKIKSRMREGYLLQDPEKETGFIGYTELLELASRVYPGDSSVYKFLGDEYKSRGHVQKAIDSYLKYLSNNDKKEPEEESSVSLALAGLYASVRNYIQSIEYYNMFLLINKEQSSRSDVIFSLGDIYFRRLGNFPQAEIQFETFLRENSGVSLSQDVISNLQILRKKMIAEFALSKIQKTRLKREKEDEYLKKALDTYEKVKEEEGKFLELLEKQKETVRLLKLKSRESVLDPDPLQEELSKLREVREIEKQMLVILKTVPVIEVYYQAAETYEDRRDFELALKYYRGIQEKGIPSDREIALKNILRIEKTLKDGIYRTRVSR